MTKQKTTKKALLTSVLSLVLCMTMLIGTTFAWFTDTATTGVNTIQSGTLDVTLMASYDKGTSWVSAENETLNFIAADGNTNILWEPGCTYELPMLKVVNKGSLALKYQIVVNGIDGDAELLEVIDWTVNGTALDEMTGKLAKGAESETLTIAGHMQETAGNKYQDKTISGVSVAVYATQDTVEFDSFDNQYDKNAFYYDVLVSSADELYKAVATASGDIVIAIDGNITLTKALSKKGLNSIKFVAFDEEATIDQATYHMYFQGAKVTFEGLTLTHAGKPYSGDGGQAATSFIVWNAVEVNYIDCTFNRSVGTLHASVHNFIGCTFNGVYNPDNALSEYPLNNYDSEETNVIDCVFNSTNRGAILFYGDNTTGEYTLNISDTYFLGDIIDDKTAVEIHSRGTSVYNVNIKDTVVGDGVINGLYRLKPANEGTVNVNVDENSISYVATASDASKLSNAINNAKEGDTIYLNTDISTTSTIQVNKDVTIDLNGKEIATTKSRGVALSKGASLKNGTVVHTKGVYAVQANNAEAIENVTIVVDNPTATGHITGIAVKEGQTIDTIKNVTIKGASQGIEVYNGGRINTIENVTVEANTIGDKEGVALLINGASVGTVINSTFKGDAYGVMVHLKGLYDVGVDFEKCKLAGDKAALYAWDEQGNIENHEGCSLTINYDEATKNNSGKIDWLFQEECLPVVKINGSTPSTTP